MVAGPQVGQAPKGSKNKELAEKFIDTVISPEAQLDRKSGLWWKPYSKKGQLPPEIQKRIPTKVIALDSRKITAGRAKWFELWTKEIGR
ncbi:MAG: hypothetical protein M1358_14015 [Chloroflexi bacterium]|nr:hypothetical protein [Chloroflexota bacterium]